MKSRNSIKTSPGDSNPQLKLPFENCPSLIINRCLCLKCHLQDSEVYFNCRLYLILSSRISLFEMDSFTINHYYSLFYFFLSFNVSSLWNFFSLTLGHKSFIFITKFSMCPFWFRAEFFWSKDVLEMDVEFHLKFNIEMDLL